jgi:hypothetical protein
MTTNEHFPTYYLQWLLDGRQRLKVPNQYKAQKRLTASTGLTTCFSLILLRFGMVGSKGTAYLLGWSARAVRSGSLLG